jgi:peptidoglycan/xylan/chitin deacetylase (PgdA/CDA1 family)
LENIFAVYAAFNEQNPDCKASATFFFNGILFDNENIQLLHTALAMGFELGNHTFSHFDLTTLSETELKAEIEKTDEILRRADGKNYHLLRAPFGKINDTVKQISPTPLIDWTIDTVDWSGANAEEIYQTVTTQCFSGAIVLFHDGYPQTIEALKRLLPDLKEQGYQIVSVSQLAKAHGCTLQSGKVYIRARKQK